MEQKFKIGDFVCVGSDRNKGNTVNTHKTFETYTMYNVHMLDDGTFNTCARHQLIKGMSDSEFPDLFHDSSVRYSAVPLKQVFDFVPNTTTTAVSPPPLSLSPLSENDSDQEILAALSELENSTSVTMLTENRRSRNMSDTDMDNIISENENFSTRKKSLCHSKLMRQFFLQIPESREPKDIPPSQLDALLSKFFVSVRQKNGSEYEPSYLRGMLGSFERFLKKTQTI